VYTDCRFGRRLTAQYRCDGVAFRARFGFVILLLHSTLASSATDSLVRALQVFQSDESFALFYFGAALAGGLLALYKERPIIIFLTSFGGSFGVFVGVGYVTITPLGVLF
jgi:hypothetical protein